MRTAKNRLRTALAPPPTSLILRSVSLRNSPRFRAKIRCSESSDFPLNRSLRIALKRAPATYIERESSCPEAPVLAPPSREAAGLKLAKKIVPNSARLHLNVLVRRHHSSAWISAVCVPDSRSFHLSDPAVFADRNSPCWRIDPQSLTAGGERSVAF